MLWLPHPDVNLGHARQYFSIALFWAGFSLSIRIVYYVTAHCAIFRVIKIFGFLLRIHLLVKFSPWRTNGQFSALLHDTGVSAFLGTKSSRAIFFKHKSSAFFAGVLLRYPHLKLLLMSNWCIFSLWFWSLPMISIFDLIVNL